MSSVNLDLVRSICAPWERSEFSAIAWQDPQIEWELADGPTPGSSTGRPGLESAPRMARRLEDVRFEASEFRELDATSAC
jgi:hypothetical protein